MKKFTLYDNGIWRISATRAANKIPVLFVENLKNGFCDWPIQYTDGKVSYDSPERIPAYVKKSVRSCYGHGKRVGICAHLATLEDCEDFI